MKTIKDTAGREKETSTTHKVVFNQIQNRINDEHKEIVEEMQKEYPETCDEFLNIMADQYVLFCKKQKNYGPGNISVGTDCRTDSDVKLSLTGLWFRLNDKVQRLLNLVVNNDREAQNEPVEDAFKDLSVYGIIAQIVKNGKWGI